ncbi:hypothetical protein [Mucilaginibacter sp.]
MTYISLNNDNYHHIPLYKFLDVDQYQLNDISLKMFDLVRVMFVII